jgi:hypothetical protein
VAGAAACELLAVACGLEGRPSDEVLSRIHLSSIPTLTGSICIAGQSQAAKERSRRRPCTISTEHGKPWLVWGQWWLGKR